MEFTLVYEGPLKSNGSVNDKQQLRRSFQGQLRQLWAQPPFSGIRDPDFVTYGNSGSRDPITHYKVASFDFVPFVSAKLNAVAELDILMLRPECPGSIITKGGDIDNRIKTLLDSLRVPKDNSEVPQGDSPTQDECPFYCLLEDDNLITKLSVSTDRLLKPDSNFSEVSLIVRVKTKVLIVTCDNIDLA